MDNWPKVTYVQGGVPSICERVLLMRNEDMPTMSWVLTVRLPQRTVYPIGCFPSNNIRAIADTVKTKTWEDLRKISDFLLPTWVRPSSPEKLGRGLQHNVQRECEGKDGQTSRAHSKPWEVLPRTSAERIPVHDWVNRDVTGEHRERSFLTL